LKYALLYTFLVPTGKIDDADNTHSDEYETPKVRPKAPAKKPVDPVEYAKKEIEAAKSADAP
jgi:hypothetical protein